MNIQEILEAHQLYWRQGDPQFYCECGQWKDETCAQEENHRAHVASVIENHTREREAQMRQLIRDMTDPDPCWFDHHGGCQAHGYLVLKPGELCPHAEAKQLLGKDQS